MIIKRVVVLVGICLSFPLNAFALEQSTSIKITELLKTGTLGTAHRSFILTQNRR